MPVKEEHKFKIVRNNKLVAQIGHQIIEAIFSGGYKPGDQLPPERDLAVLFNTSRVAVREALSGLLAKGILSTRQGSGTTINPIEEWSTLDPVILLLRGGNDTFDQLQEVRRIIEPELAALAAENITPEELKALYPLSELRLDDTLEQHIDRDISFHVAIAQATKNTVLQIVLSSIGDLLRESRRRSYTMPGELAQAHKCHQKIYSAIEKHDTAGARQAMLEHMNQVQHSLDDYKKISHEDRLKD